FDLTSTMIAYSNSLYGSGMPIQVHGVLLPTITGSELSRVRNQLQRRRILPAIPPHPVQANSHPPSHRYLGNVPLPTHHQVSIAAAPVPVATSRGLHCLPQQKTQ